MKEDVSKFVIDNQNKLLNHVWKQDNIRVIDGMGKNKKCIVICSGNSIYFPDTYEEFRTKIICNNYFDGGRLSSLLIDYVERIILIRDIRKSFYVTGISEKHNSIVSVLDLLENLTRGYEIVTAGGSAGGYMAVITGSHLNAKYVISAGGQWNLYEYCEVMERYYFLKKNKDNAICNKFFDLSERLKGNHVPVLYMYGGLNASDIHQIRCADGVDNIYPIAIKSQNHAQSVSTEPYLRLLCVTWEELLALYNVNKNQMVDVKKLEDQINRAIELPKGLSPRWATTSERKQKAYINLLYEWVRCYQESDYTRSVCCDVVAIWGKGRYCDLLMHELERENVEVSCIVETQPVDNTYKGVPIVNINNLPDNVNTIIVIPYYDIKDIKEKVYEYHPDINIMGIDEYIVTMKGMIRGD